MTVAKVLNIEVGDRVTKICVSEKNKKGYQISNSFLMPFISLMTCIFVGWVIGAKWIGDEMEKNGECFGRKKLYGFMIRYAAPVVMAVLFLQSTGFMSLFTR